MVPFASGSMTAFPVILFGRIRSGLEAKTEGGAVSSKKRITEIP
jgi:hypothetical protein